MANIQTSDKVITTFQDAFGHSMSEECLKELVTGHKMKRALEEARVRKVAQQAQSLKGHKSIPGLGKVVTEMPAHEFFRLRQKYGDEAVHDKGFHRDLHRLEPDTKINNV